MHTDRLSDELPRPLNELVVQLVHFNCEKWLTGRNRHTRGAESVRETGLTTNQQRWVNELAEQIDKKSGDDE